MECLIEMVFVVNGEEDRDFSKFMVKPNDEEERRCYEAFYDATLNNALRLRTCPICAQEKLVGEGNETSLLSDPSVMEVLGRNMDDGGYEGTPVIMR